MGRFNDNRRSGGGRDRGRPEMHRATCSDCGKGCEVPFRPTRGKDVYCNDCFGGSQKPNFGGRDRDRGRGGFDQKRMHTTICAGCGEQCEVPFRPTGEKPVYCSACFGGSKGGFGSKKSDRSNEQLEDLNKKLDKIIKLLEIISDKKQFTIEKADAELAEEKPKKKAATKKKAPAKKKKA